MGVYRVNLVLAVLVLAALVLMPKTLWAQVMSTTTSTVEPGNPEKERKEAEQEAKRAADTFENAGIDTTVTFTDNLTSAIGVGPTNPQRNVTSGVVPIAGGLRATGQAAGDDGDYPWGIWASYAHNSFENDFVSTAFDADSDSVIAGADISPYENWVFGVSFGYDTTDVDTRFNAGSQDIDTYTVAPYIGGYLSDYLGVEADVSMSLVLGYSWVDLDQLRRAAGTRITSSTDSDRIFYSASLTGGKQFGDFYGSITSSILGAHSDIDGFTDSSGLVVADDDTSFGRFSIGAEVSYLFNSFEPFVSLTYRYDYDREDLIAPFGSPQPSNDKDDGELGVGLRYFGDSAISGSLLYNTTFGRDDVDEDSINILLRADF